MRFFRLLSLVFVLAALFFGAVQLFYRMQHLPVELTLASLLQNVAVDTGALLNRLPGGTLQDLVAIIIHAPAWLASLCLAGTLWLVGGLLGERES